MLQDLIDMVRAVFYVFCVTIVVIVCLYVFLILGGFITHWLTSIFKFGWNLF